MYHAKWIDSEIYVTDALPLDTFVIYDNIVAGRTLKKLNETEEKERLAEYGASLTILIIILVGLFVFTYGLIWSLAYEPEDYYLNNIKNGRKLY